MKNKIFLAALASLTLAACSNDEVISEQKNNIDLNSITFRTAVTNSRAEAVTSLDRFWVTALTEESNFYEWGDNDPVREFVKGDDGFYNVKVNIDQTTGKEENAVTWPTYNLKFYASNLDATNAKYKLIPPTDLESQPQYQNISPETSVKDQIDFVYSTNLGAREDFKGSSVPLTFKHALSQIEIQAKCASTVYKVKVKGYRIASAKGTATFTFGKPVSIGGVNTDKTYETVYPEGTWSFAENVKTADYSSEFRGGYGYKADVDYSYDGFYDESNTGNTSNHYIELSGADYTTISASTTEGTAMLLPQSGADYLDLETGEGTRIDLLVQVDKLGDNLQPTDKCIFPIAYTKEDGSVERVSYRHLPKYYGYMSIPVTFTWEQGKKYIYQIDLTTGLGYADASDPQVVDPGVYDPKNDENPTIDENTGKEEELTEDQGGIPDEKNPDTLKANDPILDVPIEFINVTVKNWDPIIKPA